MIDIDLDNLNEEDVYNAFGVDGNEGEALNDIYLELYELIGCQRRYEIVRKRRRNFVVFRR